MRTRIDIDDLRYLLFTASQELIKSGISAIDLSTELGVITSRSRPLEEWRVNFFVNDRYYHYARNRDDMLLYIKISGEVAYSILVDIEDGQVFPKLAVVHNRLSGEIFTAVRDNRVMYRVAGCPFTKTLTIEHRYGPVPKIEIEETKLDFSLIKLCSEMRNLSGHIKHTPLGPPILSACRLVKGSINATVCTDTDVFAAMTITLLVQNAKGHVVDLCGETPQFSLSHQPSYTGDYSFVPFGGLIAGSTPNLSNLISNLYQAV